VSTVADEYYLDREGWSSHKLALFPNGRFLGLIRGCSSTFSEIGDWILVEDRIYLSGSLDQSVQRMVGNSGRDGFQIRPHKGKFLLEVNGGSVLAPQELRHEIRMAQNPFRASDAATPSTPALPSKPASPLKPILTHSTAAGEFEYVGPLASQATLTLFENGRFKLDAVKEDSQWIEVGNWTCNNHGVYFEGYHHRDGYFMSYIARRGGLKAEPFEDSFVFSSAEEHFFYPKKINIMMD
jgi:hypothetical protein